MKYLTPLSDSGVLLSVGYQLKKKEKRRIEGAHAVLLFVSKERYKNTEFKDTVDYAVKNNKNILVIYLDDVETDAWGHMQLDSAQALFFKKFETEEAFIEKLKEAEIFRKMEVTPQQKRNKILSAISTLLMLLFCAGLMYVLLIAPRLYEELVATEIYTDYFALDGMTQDDLDAITEIIIIGDEVRGINDNYNNEIFSTFDGKWNDERDWTERGSISDLSEFSKCHNLTTLHIVGNNVTDLTPLREMPQLTNLVLDENPITSLEGMEILTNLDSLSVKFTKITDITPICELEQLKYLSISGTDVSNIPDNGFVEQLSGLDVSGTFIDRIPYLGDGIMEYICMANRMYPDGDISFLKDKSAFGVLVVVGASNEQLREYLGGKTIVDLTLDKVDFTSLNELDWIEVTRDMNRIGLIDCKKLTSLDGIEQFQGIDYFSLFGDTNITDYTPVLNLGSISYFEIHESQREAVEEQLGDTKFKLVVRND